MQMMNEYSIFLSENYLIIGTTDWTTSFVQSNPISRNPTGHEYARFSLANSYHSLQQLSRSFGCSALCPPIVETQMRFLQFYITVSTRILSSPFSTYHETLRSSELIWMQNVTISRSRDVHNFVCTWKLELSCRLDMLIARVKSDKRSSAIEITVWMSVIELKFVD